VDRTDLALQGVEHLLSALLEISKLDAGAVRPEITHFRIQDVLDRLAEEYCPVVDEAGLELRMVDCSAVVASDRKLLDRVLRNFLSNAVRYTGSGSILLGCRRRGDELLVQVTDTGPGICDSELGAIFDEFRQLDSIQTSGTPGVGLGLAIVKRITEMLEVNVRVASQLDHGSTFSVGIPISSRKLKPVTTLKHTVRAVTTPLLGASVLVVDNEYRGRYTRRNVSTTRILGLPSMDGKPDK